MYKQRESAVFGSARPGAQSCGDLLLHHNRDALEASRFQKGGQQGRGHIVREIGADSHGPVSEILAAQRAEIGLRGIGEYHRDIRMLRERLGENSAEPLVQLQREHALRLFGQLDGETAYARPNLQHAVSRGDESLPGNAPGHPRRGKEILAEAFGKAESVPFQQSRDLFVIRKIHHFSIFSKA